MAEKFAGVCGGGASQGAGVSGYTTCGRCGLGAAKKDILLMHIFFKQNSQQEQFSIKILITPRLMYVYESDDIKCFW